MLRIVSAIAVLGLTCSGCSLLGFGSDESETSVEPPAAVEETQTAEPTPAPAAKTAQKAAKTTAKAARGAKTEAQIKAELDKMGHKLASQSARTLLPNKANPEVKKVGNEWVATYIHVNTDNVTTELRPGSNGQYVGFIRYQEEVMECRGASRQAALKAPCTQVRTRRLNELIRYDGRAWQD